MKRKSDKLRSDHIEEQRDSAALDVDAVRRELEGVEDTIREQLAAIDPGIITGIITHVLHIYAWGCVCVCVTVRINKTKTAAKGATAVEPQQ